MDNCLPVAVVILYRRLDACRVALWAQKRQEKGPLDGLWEFPGGKIKAQEAPLEAAYRELAEEVTPQLAEQVKLTAFSITPYSYPDRQVVLYSFIGQFQDDWAHGGQWLDFRLDSDSGPWREKIPAANCQLIDQLLQFFSEQNPATKESKAWN